MKKLSHEERIKHSNLMREFCYDTIESKYDAIEGKGRYPWETVIWHIKWPELSAFLSDRDSTYGSSKEDYETIMEQFFDVQLDFRWMIKAHYLYMKENAHRFGLEAMPSVVGFYLPKLIVVLIIIAVAVYFFMT